MNTLNLTYDGNQHATALREPHHISVAIDCPFTAKGDEFSPGNLLGISVERSFGSETNITATYNYAIARAA